MRKLSIVVLMIMFIVFAGMFISVAAYYLFPTGIVEANPNKCAPGQEKKDGCLWVQHRVTGKCMWMPSESDGAAWNPVSEGTCPPLAIDTSTVQPVIYSTTVPLIMTCTPSGIPVIQASFTPIPLIVTPAAGSITANPVSSGNLQSPGAVIPTIGCDICDAYKRQADALSTMAAVQATDSAWRRR